MLHFVKYMSIFVVIIVPGLGFGSLISDGAEGYARVVELHHRMNNMYFYASVMILTVSIPALARLKNGGRMRPGLSRAVAGLIKTANFVCLMFLVIHFMPETATVFDWLGGLFGRIF